MCVKLSSKCYYYEQVFPSYLLHQGPDAEGTLQLLCSNNMAVSPGKVVYTAMLNRQGGFQTDCTVTRLSTNKLVITP